MERMIIKEFGRRYYENVGYFNFDESEEYKQFFETTKDGNCILQNLMFMISYLCLPIRNFGLYDIYMQGSLPYPILSFGQIYFYRMLTILMDYLIVTTITVAISYVTNNNLMTFAILALLLMLPMVISSNTILPWWFDFSMPSRTLGNLAVWSNSLAHLNDCLYFRIWIVHIVYGIIGIGVYGLIYHTCLHHKK